MRRATPSSICSPFALSLSKRAWPAGLARDQSGSPALRGFVAGGASHLCVRFTGGDAERQMDTLAEMRAGMG